ncbi:MAG: pentapeptide repeat-containing protein [ANME-2 cluster archaeon]|nr:MAG: pentapeptide repeat-containing protein [ANME-2 cluster archaeon]
MRMLGDSIKIKGYEEELLIKWSVLNFSSKYFIKEVNKNHEVLTKMEGLSDLETIEERDKFIETLDEPYKKSCHIFRQDEKIINVLKSGDKRFKDIDISSYIFFSSIAPKEPGKKGIKIEPGANLNEADLSGANLIQATIIEADLSGAYLSGANLSGTNLIEANLSGADLFRVDLIEANLSGANLNRANLIEANLSVANLSGANLSGAYLSGANLNRANLSGAILSNTKFFGAHFDEECLKTILESKNWMDVEFDSDVRKKLENMSGLQS